MDSLQDLLGDYSPKEPPEIAGIKRYVMKRFNEPCSVAVQGDNLVVTIGSASLANTLRFRLTELQQAAGSKKKIVLRIRSRSA